ncbi:DUF2711 domain-containing protein [Bacillus infantis]|uniref:DUF2711 domain-containing protein n=1 Tax=Bacillus infantis TaxID=324767 RepID=UPI00301ABB1A
MLNYLWLDHCSPILGQLPAPFKSCAILLHPFVRMPAGWTAAQPDSEDVFLSGEEALEKGQPVPWQKVMKDSGLNSLDELALALQTAIVGLRKEYARKDLAEALDNYMDPDLYLPPEDQTSVFLLGSLLNVLGSKQPESIYYSSPIPLTEGSMPLKEAAPLGILGLSNAELIITDQQMDYAFMSVIDSFITLFLAKETDIEHIIRSSKWEAIICGNNTCLNWYLQENHT